MGFVFGDSAIQTDSCDNLIPIGYCKVVLIVAEVFVIAVAICVAIAVAVGTSQSLNKIHTQWSESGINDKEDLLDIDMKESQQLFMDVSAHTCD